MPILEIDDLRVHYVTPHGVARAVDGASFAIEAGQIVGLVGESGCGKTTLARAIPRVMPKSARVAGGRILFEGEDLLTVAERRMNAYRWKQIAFIRRHGEGDLDKTPNSDVFVIDARAGAEPRRLTMTTAEESGRMAWSPDGKSIAYLLGDELKYSAYDQNRLVVIPSAGGSPRTLTDALDRPVSSPEWSADGRSIAVVVVDDRAEYVASERVVFLWELARDLVGFLNFHEVRIPVVDVVYGKAGERVHQREPDGEVPGVAVQRAQQRAHRALQLQPAH